MCHGQFQKSIFYCTISKTLVLWWIMYSIMNLFTHKKKQHLSHRHKTHALTTSAVFTTVIGYNKRTEIVETHIKYTGINVFLYMRSALGIYVCTCALVLLWVKILLLNKHPGHWIQVVLHLNRVKISRILLFLRCRSGSMRLKLLLPNAISFIPEQSPYGSCLHVII